MNFVPYWMYTGNNMPQYLWINVIPQPYAMSSSVNLLPAQQKQENKNQLPLNVKLDREDLNSMRAEDKIDLQGNVRKIQIRVSKRKVKKQKKIIAHRNRDKNKDPDFLLRSRAHQKRNGQTLGRNQLSNTFRAFLKLSASESYKSCLEKKFEIIKEKHNLTVSFQSFYQSMLSSIPNCSTYINKSKFREFYAGNGQVHFVIRIMFHKFLRGAALNHILTVRPKKKINQKSILEFLGILRKVENLIIDDHQVQEHTE